MERKFIRGKQAPYINSKLRKAINVKNILRRRYNNIKSDGNWKKYGKQRNDVVRLRK